MQRKCIILGLAILIFGLIGCSSNNNHTSKEMQEAAADDSRETVTEKEEISDDADQKAEEPEETKADAKSKEAGEELKEDRPDEETLETDTETGTEEAEINGEEQEDAAFLSPTSAEYEIEKLEKAGEWTEISAEYPVFGMEEADKAIEMEVKKHFEEFETEFEENEKLLAEIPYEGGESLYFWEPTITDDYISFMFGHVMDFGGPHPYTYQYPFNYDLKNQRELSIQNLVKNESQLSNLGDLIYSKLENEGPELDMLEEATQPEWENFQQFVLTDDSIIFHYEHYVLGPYAYGVFDVEVTFDELNAL
ncbi:RsiV family protein [Oceanobacillus aidingensis]|uniref:RsiV family protein n=1 Tax=Oceanobacillus aidingensis TaxID=645964 RepID=A0ABV9JSP3_9BACI